MTKAAAWTPEEDAILKEHYPKLEKCELKGLVPGRTTEEMCRRAGVLKLKKTPLVRKKTIKRANQNMKNSTIFY